MATVPSIVLGEVTLPQVTVTPAATFMWSELQGLGPQLLWCLDAEARTRGVRSIKTVVDRFTDPEEGREELVITQHVDLRPDAALEYWDGLSRAVAEWSDTLPSIDAQLVREKVAISVAWLSALPLVRALPPVGPVG